MKSAVELKNVRRAVGNCIRCTMCTYGDWPSNLTICPMYLYDKCFTYSGGGFMYLAKSLIDKKLVFDSKVSDLIFTCPGCLACDDICEIIPFSEPNVRPFDIIRLMRHEAVKKRLVSKERFKEIKEMKKEIRRYGEALSPNRGNIFNISDKIYDENSSQVLFVEEMFLRSPIYRSILRIFEKIGEPIGGISDGGSNFPELYDLGFWEEVEEYLTTKFDIRGLKGKELIFINPHFQEFIMRKYPEIISEYEGIKIRHISEVLLDALKGNKLRSKKGLKKVKVSYHDPCYLGRGIKIYEPPREVLLLIDGVELIEMERNRRDCFCCGGRGRDNYFSDFSKKTALERLNEFKRTKADFLITACPYCKAIFKKTLKREEQYRVKDLTEFVEEYVQ